MEGKGNTAGTIAGLFALAVFAVAILAGLFAGNAATAVIGRALVAMLICYPVGLLIGIIATRVVDGQDVDAGLDAEDVVSSGRAEAPDEVEASGEEILVV